MRCNPGQLRAARSCTMLIFALKLSGCLVNMERCEILSCVDEHSCAGCARATSSMCGHPLDRRLTVYHRDEKLLMQQDNSLDVLYSKCAVSTRRMLYSMRQTWMCGAAVRTPLNVMISLRSDGALQ